MSRIAIVFVVGSKGLNLAILARLNVSGKVGAAKLVQSIPMLEFTRMQLYDCSGEVYQSIVTRRYDPVGREVSTVKGSR